MTDPLRRFPLKWKKLYKETKTERTYSLQSQSTFEGLHCAKYQKVELFSCSRFRRILKYVIYNFRQI
jgi:hypothetical protein